MHSVRGYVSGRVQGVGFRYFVKRHADSLAVYGYAKNLPDGRVEFLLQGEECAVLSVLENIRCGPSYSQVSEVNVKQCVSDETSDRFLTL
jgi:acylphosphatase